MPHDTTPQPVQPIAPTPPCEEKLVFKFLHAGRVVDFEVIVARKPIDPERHPGWLGVDTSVGHVAARVVC